VLPSGDDFATAAVPMLPPPPARFSIMTVVPSRCCMCGSTIPIVFILVADPVANKLVASFNRPGGNLTGLSQMALDLTGKRLEILKEATGISRLAFLVNPADRQFARAMVEET